MDNIKFSGITNVVHCHNNSKTIFKNTVRFESDSGNYKYISLSGSPIIYSDLNFNELSFKLTNVTNHDIGIKRNSAPTSGVWNVGDIVYNFSPSEQGTAGSKYIIKSWECIALGEPGIWQQNRVLTGN